MATNLSFSDLSPREPNNLLNFAQRVEAPIDAPVASPTPYAEPPILDQPADVSDVSNAVQEPAVDLSSVIPKANTTTTQVNPWDRAICVSVTLGKWGTSRQADMDSIETDVDEEYINATKKLLKCKEFDAIKHIDAEVRKLIKKCALPSYFRAGFYLVSKVYVAKLQEALKKCKAKREAAVKAFIEVYPVKKEEARGRLKSQYCATDYPSTEVMASQFYMDWMYVNFSTPDSLSEIDYEMFAEERAKLDEQMKQAGQELVVMMRKEASKLIGRLAEKLVAPREGEKKKAVRESTVQNIQEFLEFFDIKNIADDKELYALIARTRAAMSGADGNFIDTDDLRSNDALRDTVRTQLEAVGAEINNLLINKPTRTVTFVDQA